MEHNSNTLRSTIHPQRQRTARPGRREGESATSTPSSLTIQTQLPPEYVELEKRVDALREVHQRLLAVT